MIDSLLGDQLRRQNVNDTEYEKVELVSCGPN